MNKHVFKPSSLAIVALLSVGLFTTTSCQKEEAAATVEQTSTEQPLPEGYYRPSFIGKTIKAHYNGMDVELLEIENGKYLYDGDVVLERNDFTLPGEPITNGVYGGKNWPNRIVYWKYAAGVSQTIKDRWVGATQAWSNDLGFQFRNATASTTDYIEVQENTDGRAYSSSIGRKGGKQVISMSINGFSTGSMIHEIGHAVGLIHEQKRPDRDQYITVNYSNIRPSWKSQYDKCSNCTANGSFDFNSIMLYGPKAGSSVVFNTSIPAMTKKDGSLWTAQRSYLSAGDKAAINAKY